MYRWMIWWARPPKMDSHSDLKVEQVYYFEKEKKKKTNPNLHHLISHIYKFGAYYIHNHHLTL